jgi:hypothetical protein
MYMKRKLCSEVTALLGVALFIFSHQSEGTSLIVIATKNHIILASDSQFIHDGKAVNDPIKKITCGE